MGAKQRVYYSTGKRAGLEIPNHLAAAAIDAGEAQVKADESIQVASPGGKVKTIAGADFAQHLGEGYRFIPQDELREFEQKEESETVKGHVRTFATSTAEGLTNGLSTAALVAAGSDPETIKRDRKYNPGTHVAGSIIGAAAPVILSGGAGLAGQAARMTPAGALAAGAARLGGGAAKLLGARGVPTGVARAAGMALEGAAEGAVANMGQALADSSLGDYQLNAETLLGSAGSGALLGGTFGAGMGALSGGLGAIGRAKTGKLGSAVDSARVGAVDSTRVKPVDIPTTTPEQAADAARAAGLGAEEINAAAGRQARDIAAATAERGQVELAATAASEAAAASAYDSSVLGKITNAYKSMASKGARVRGGDLAELGAGGRVGSQTRANVFEEVEKQKKFVQDFGADTETMLASRRPVMDIIAGEERLRNVARTVPDNPEIVPGVERYLDELFDDAQDLKVFNDLEVGHLKKGGGAGKRGESLPDWIISTRTDGSTPAEAMVALEDLRQAMFRESKMAKGAVTSAGSTDSKRAALTRMKRADEIGQSLRSYLEDTNIWGEAAVNRTRRNAAIYQKLDLDADYSKKFEKTIGERESDQHWQFNKVTSDLVKIDDFANVVTDYRRADLVDQTKRALDSRINLYSELLEVGDVPVKYADNIAASLEAAKRSRAGLEDFIQVKTDGDTMRRAVEEQGGSVANAVGSTSVLVGGLTGGIPGAAVGAAVQSVTKPTSAIGHIASIEALERRLRGVSGKLDGAVSKAVGAVSKLQSGRKKGAVQAYIAAFGDTENKRRGAFDRRMKKIELWRSSPADSMEDFRLRVVGPTVAGAAPALAQELLAQYGRSMAYLESTAPVQVKMGGFQGHLKSYPVPQVEIDRWAKRVAVVEDPSSILRDLEGGSLSVDAVDALKAVYPKQYERIRTVALETMAESKTPLPYDNIVRISLLLDIPGEPTLEPEFTRLHQGIMAIPPAPAQNKPIQAGGGGVAKNHQTESERLSNV